MAPNTIKMISMAIKKPFAVAAPIQEMGIFQINEAINTVTIQVKGIAWTAFHLNIAINVKTSRIGVRAKIINQLDSITIHLRFCLKYKYFFLNDN